LYTDAAATSKKQIEKYPNLADGHWNLGWAFFEEEKFAESVAAYETASKLNAKNARLFIQLGRAYAANHELDKARSAFDHALQLETSPLTLNDVAYYSAEAGLDLKLADEQATHAVAAVEKQVSAITLKDVGRGTGGLLTRLAAYWDTLGWIKFKQKDLQMAEKYLRGATDLSDDPTIQMHMGRVQESLGHKEAAMRCYVTALFIAQIVQIKFAPQGGAGVPQPVRPLTPEERESKQRLLALAGSQKEFDEQMKEGSYNRNWKRTVTVPYNESQELEERGLVAVVQPGPRISANGVLPTMKTQSKLLERFGERTPPQTFPDNGATSIPRIGIIRCHISPAQCEFEFLPNGQAENVLAEMGNAQ
jgi:tetratricopeptide (TPR) repeat protein